MAKLLDILIRGFFMTYQEEISYLTIVHDLHVINKLTACDFDIPNAVLWMASNSSYIM